MPLEFTFEADGDRLVSRRLEDLGSRGLDVSPAFHVIADDLREYERARFESRGEGTWKPLKASTVREKARKGQDPRVLHATLKLLNSLTRKGDGEQEQIITPTFLLFGSKVHYSGFHQRGTHNRDGSRRMVARKPLGFTELQKRTVMRHIQRFVVTGSPVE